ncbi:MAG TPA: polymer-forming cytoskeletal protein [Candidatus Eisenbacteria bacterium]|jgi:cytoskeletal protein CcmA (bactofilin family)
MERRPQRFAMTACLAVLWLATPPLSKPGAADPLALGLLGPSPAWAQEVMEFKPVPEESVAAIERRARERARSDVPPLPPAPAVPEVTSRSGEIVRIGSDIHIEKDRVVVGDVVALQGDVRVDGHVKGDVMAAGGDVFLSATARVDGDVACIGGQLHEEPGAFVGGQRTSFRGPGGRHVGHRLRERLRDWDVEEQKSRAGGVVGAVVWLMLWMAAAWGISKLAPVRTGTAVETLSREPGMSFLVGLVTALLLAPSVIALALVVAILCITIIGIPLALGVILAYVALLVVLTIWGALVGVVPIGRQLARRLMGGSLPGSPAPAAVPIMRAAVLGVLVLDGLHVVGRVFEFMPLLGWVGTLIGVLWWISGSLLTLLGAGALIRSKFGRGPGASWWPLWIPVRPGPSAPAAPAFSTPDPGIASPSIPWTGAPPTGGPESPTPPA